MTGEAGKFIYLLGLAVGQIRRCNDQDVAHLAQWAKTVFERDHSYVLEFIEAEQKRRAAA